jgi:hypothetical protein
MLFIAQLARHPLGLCCVMGTLSLGCSHGPVGPLNVAVSQSMGALADSNERSVRTPPAGNEAANPAAFFPAELGPEALPLPPREPLPAIHVPVAPVTDDGNSTAFAWPRQPALEGFTGPAPVDLPVVEGLPSGPSFPGSNPPWPPHAQLPGDVPLIAPPPTLPNGVPTVPGAPGR